MAVPPPKPHGGGLPRRGGAPAGGRSSSATGDGQANRGPEPAYSNRPIPLTPTDDNPLPEAVYDADLDEVDDLSEILRNAPA